MTPETIKLEQFHGLPVRCVYEETSGRWMIPVVDIAAAVKMDRSNLTKMLKRHGRFFDEYKGMVQITSPGGEQSFQCLTRDGILGLLFKVNATKSKDPQIEDRIIEFQHHATKILGKYSDGTLYIQKQTPSAISPDVSLFNPLDVVNDHLDMAELVSRRCEIPKGIAVSMALSIAATKTDNELLNAYASHLKAQTQPEQLALPEGDLLAEEKAEYERHFSLTKVADILNQSVDKVRNALETLGLIYYDNKIWHLTKRGEQFGKMFKVYPGFPYSTQERAYIKYNPDAIKVLKTYFGEGKTVQNQITGS